MSSENFSPDRDEQSCSGDVPAYALGALEPAEADAFRRHLRSCAVCPVELRAFQQVVDDLAISAPLIDAPPELRRRVMRAVEAEPRTDSATAERSPRRRAPWARSGDQVLRRDSWLRGPQLALGSGIAFALAAFVVVILAFPGRQNGRTVHASTSVGGAAALHISANRTDLVVRHVAAPPHGKIYEVWLQRGKAKPVPSSLFGVDRDGDASVDVSGSLYGVSHVYVTAEPAPGGTRTPTSSPVISASLS
jgi:anti-sigma factor RsiW